MGVDKHNELAREFIMKVAGQTSGLPDMMVVVESCLLAAMLVLHRRDGMTKANAAEMIEAAVQQAMERLSHE